MQDMNLSAVPDGDLVLECDRMLSMEEMENIRKSFHSCLPERKVLILMAGMHLYPLDNHAALLRLEQKLDALAARIG